MFDRVSKTRPRIISPGSIYNAVYNSTAHLRDRFDSFRIKLRDVLGKMEELGSLRRKVYQLETRITQSEAEKAQLKIDNLRLAELSTTDDLTGLWNKRYFNDQINIAFESNCYRRSNPLSLLFIDADHFKNINDAFGHPVGDRVLKELAAILRDAVRKEDVCARYGGEEFVILLHDTDASKALALAERIRGQVERHDFFENSVRVPLTVSIGVSTFDPKLNSERLISPREELIARFIKAADDAVLCAKRNGRNTVVAEPRAVA